QILIGRPRGLPFPIHGDADLVLETDVLLDLVSERCGYYRNSARDIVGEGIVKDGVVVGEGSEAEIAADIDAVAALAAWAADGLVVAAIVAVHVTVLTVDVDAVVKVGSPAVLEDFAARYSHGAKRSQVLLPRGNAGIPVVADEAALHREGGVDPRVAGIIEQHAENGVAQQHRIAPVRKHADEHGIDYAVGSWIGDEAGEGVAVNAILRVVDRHALEG